MGEGESTGERGVEDLLRLPPAIGGVQDGNEGNIGFAHGWNIIQERAVTGSSLTTPTLQGFSPSTPFLQGPLFTPKKAVVCAGFAVRAVSPQQCTSSSGIARYFIFEGNVNVLPATMNVPLPR